MHRYSSGDEVISGDFSSAFFCCRVCMYVCTRKSRVTCSGVDDRHLAEKPVAQEGAEDRRRRCLPDGFRVPQRASSERLI